MAKRPPSGRRRGAPKLRLVRGGREEGAGRGARGRRAAKAGQGKRVQFDIETWQALDLLARDRMMTFQELADEAFRDLLRKHGRPSSLKDALRRSARTDDAKDGRRKPRA